MSDYVKDCIEKNNFGDVSDWKNITKRIVWERERIRWKVTCAMYKELTLYNDAVQDIVIHPWWKFARKKCNLVKETSAVMAVLLGGQPRGMQINIEQSRCNLCSQNENETNIHVLLKCTRLNLERTSLLRELKTSMPTAMAEDVNSMLPSQVCMFLLSGMNSQFIPEWINIYEKICKFVYNMYKTRRKLYDDANLSNI